MAVVTMRQLLESGVHFGHRTQRWNPKMKRYIFTERNGIYIIDLQQSLPYIDSAYEFVKETVAHGGTVMFVGTKKQAQSAISEQATRVGMPYVNQRWLGGMLTNFSTVHKRLQRLKELDEVDFEDVAGSGMTKKELLGLEREHTKLDRTLGGIRDMTRTPGAIWVVDTNKEHIAVAEARKLNIPVISILDTNCDPDLVDYKIPGNDDAIRSINLLTRVIADAVAEGLMARAGARGEGVPGEELAGDEPLADWERELYLQSDVSAAAGADQAVVAEVAAEAPVAAPVEAPSAAVAPAAEDSVLTSDPVEAAAADEIAAVVPAAEPAAEEPAADATAADASTADANTADATTADATAADANTADATAAEATPAEAASADEGTTTDETTTA